MTFDPTSSLARRRDPEAVRNFRIPALDLDSVYGGGPVVSPHLYDQDVDGGRTTLLVEPIDGSAAVALDGRTRWDLPRNRQHVALIGDPRNDEHLILSQLHLAWLRFHNRVLADVKDDLGSGLTHQERFEEAQRRVRWHHQWLIIHEFLARTVGRALVDDILENGPRHYAWRYDPFIPVEFSVAAFRFGHSQVRPSYRANFGTSADDPAKQFIALVFHPGAAGSDPADLRGGRRAPRRFIDWQTFFDFGDGRVRSNKLLDTKLSSPLFALMNQPAGEPTSLATRNFLRHLVLGVPSGQRVARKMRVEPLCAGDLDDLAPFDLQRRTPLWFYVLREAEILESGERLGPVGGRIVAEVILGLISGDEESYLSQDPGWTPDYGCGGRFAMVDLLRAAGVVGAMP
jgi:hypothetical protein